MFTAFELFAGLLNKDKNNIATISIFTIFYEITATFRKYQISILLENTRKIIEVN
jgi:hypothetical protein